MNRQLLRTHLTFPYSFEIIDPLSRAHKTCNQSVYYQRIPISSNLSIHRKVLPRTINPMIFAVLLWVQSDETCTDHLVII